MIQLPLLLLSMRTQAALVNIPKLLGAEQPAVERMIGKAFKPKREPGYFFTPKGLSRVRINAFGRDMNAVYINFATELTPSQALRSMGLDPSKATFKPEPSPANAQVQLTRNKVQIRVKTLSANTKSHKPWVLEFEQDAVANMNRTNALKSKIQVATGPEKIKLIQSCYDWRASVLLDSR
ncbi:MAG TPA: hypothetical protein VGL56_18710 [Fimbriimonadaceae bacterium]|jgi:hypothetical protein